MEYYLLVKKNKIMLFAGKWMELEILVLSKISQIQKDNTCFLSYSEPRFFFKGMKEEEGTIWEEERDRREGEQRVTGG
jgi:hypothetical protein